MIAPALTQEMQVMQTERGRTPLSPDDLTCLATGETTLRPEVRRTRPRDEIQKYFDGLITDAYKKWVEAGKPSARRDRPALRVDCPTKEMADEVWNRLRASAVYLRVGVSLDPVNRVAENKWRVAFSAQDLRKRSPKAK